MRSLNNSPLVCPTVLCPLQKQEWSLLMRTLNVSTMVRLPPGPSLTWHSPVKAQPTAAHNITPPCPPPPLQEWSPIRRALNISPLAWLPPAELLLTVHSPLQTVPVAVLLVQLFCQCP